MNIVWTIIFMAVIGAFIGGLTNYIAIKMLFRPYNAIFIGKWKLPFTPGLIPRRREELAQQMGLLVVNYLVTPETIRKKILNEKFQTEISNLINRKIKEMFQSDRTLQEIGLQFKIDFSQHITMKLEDSIRNFVNDWLEENKEKQVGQVISTKVWDYSERQIPNISNHILHSMKSFMESERGKRLISEKLDEYLTGKGRLGGMLQMFVGNLNLTEKIHNELVGIVAHPDNQQLFNTLLNEELVKIKQMTTSEVIEKFTKENTQEQLFKQLIAYLPIKEWLERPISSLPLLEIERRLTQNVVPKLLSLSFDKVSENIGNIMDKFQIVDMVKAQVDSFPTQRLEELVLAIINRELKMITFLGALLGGLIGIVQGIIVLTLG